MLAQSLAMPRAKGSLRRFIESEQCSKGMEEEGTRRGQPSGKGDAGSAGAAYL